ncbi:MAG: tetratricopeptide repeat protein [Nitrospinae bacterium]|nr:tetratricopeptide repeat protein [Nitrospinota bacterium]
MKNITTQLKVIAVLSLLGILTFFGTLRSPFLYDDAHAIVENPHIRNLWDFQNTIGIENIFNRSVVLLTYAVNREVGRLDAGHLDVFGFHLVNILIHICVGIVLYFLTQALLAIETRQLQARLRPLPLFAASIHLLHPLTVQPVAYLSNRSSLLVTLFFLLGFYFFIQSVRGWKPGDEMRSLSHAGIALLFFFLGAGSKETIVTLPVMAMAYLWFKTPRMETNKFVIVGMLILFPVLVYLGARYMQMGNLLVLKADPGSLMIDRGLYFLTQMKALVFYYLLKLFLPLNLNFEPDVILVSGVLDPEWMTGFAVMVLLGAGLYLQNSRLARFAFFWALVTILPTSSLIPLKQIVSEHRAYLPGVGICLALGVGGLTAVRHPANRSVMIFTFLLLIALLTLNRSLDYRTEVHLWQDTALKSPQKALVRNNLAAAYLGEKGFDEALKEIEITLKLDPLYTYAHINRGHIYSRQENWQAARIEFDRGLLLGSPKAEAFFNAALVRTYLNQPEESISFFKEAIKIKPHRAKYHFELGNVYRFLNRQDEALAEYRLTLSTEPGHFQAQNNIGVLFWNLKQYDLAAQAFQNALTLGANNSEIQNNLASIYMIQKRHGQAIPHLEQLLALQPDNAKAKELLKVATTLAGVNP